MTSDRRTRSLSHASAGLNASRWDGAGVERYTPRDLFAALDAEFDFTLDPCATPESATCERFFTREDNGLVQDWGTERVFCNPPYGKGIYEWVAKAYRHACGGGLAVLLVPAATDTAWWHDYAVFGEVWWIRGRVAFLRPGMVSDGGHAPHASCIVVFRPGVEREPMRSFEWRPVRQMPRLLPLGPA